MSKHKYKVGDKITFTDYAVAEGEVIEDPEFETGDSLTIIQLGEDDEQYVAEKDSDKDIQGYVFEDEFEMSKPKKKAKKKVSREVVAKKAAKKTAKKVQEEPEAEEEVAEEEVAEEKPTKKRAAKKAAKKVVKKATKKVAKKKAAKKLKEPEEEEVVEVVDTEGVAEILEGQGLLDAAKELSEKSDTNDFLLGGILSHIYFEKTYLDIEDENNTRPYDRNKGFELYVIDELGIRYRKAKHLVNIYMKFSKLGLGEQELSQVGWSKAKELLNYINEDNCEELLEYAESHSRSDLQEYIRETFVEVGDGKESTKAKKCSFKFVLFEDKADAVNEALAAAKRSSGAETDSEAFDFITTEWLATLSGEQVSLETAIKTVEDRFGVELGIENPAKVKN